MGLEKIASKQPLAQYPIRVVARRTGLSTHVIRIWERRYAALAPQRTLTNRRLYTDQDIDRLQLLRQVLAQGHSIGQVARRSDRELAQLVADASEIRAEFRAEVSSKERAAAFLARCREAVSALDRVRLERALAEASASLSMPDVLELVVTPLMDCIGEDWRQGAVRVANEHLASAAVRSFLAMRKSTFQPASSAPAVVLTTPNGQNHEIGALMAAVVAVSEGWRDIYLGANLPADEIAGAVWAGKARALALSVVYPGDDPMLTQEMELLRTVLPKGLPILVGGRSSSSYGSLWNRIGAVQVTSLEDFRLRLGQIREHHVVGEVLDRDSAE
ncbi:MAG: hypothetical protein AMXMBFR84_46360 [Candidatus Hydrogenedentota bacterium]